MVVTDNSKIFFTIYRNRYLNKVIFDGIKSINRYKKSLLDPDLALSYIREYQYINNVRWMVSFGHFGLLKDKLKRKEFLLLDSESCIYGIVSKVVDRETFELLFNRYRDEFRNYGESLIAIAIKHGNISAIQVLICDEDYKNNEDIKMIDLAISSGNVEILEFVIIYLKSQENNLDTDSDSSEDFDNSNGISSILNKNFTRDSLIKNIFSCPISLLPSMVDCIFNPDSIASYLNISMEQIKTNQIYKAQFSDIFSLLPYKCLKFFLKNQIVSFSTESFVSAFNSFTPFTNEINPNSFLEYLKKFVYVFTNYYKNSTKEYLESIKQSLKEIKKLVELLNLVNNNNNINYNKNKKYNNLDKEKLLIQELESIENYKPIIAIKSKEKDAKSNWNIGKKVFSTPLFDDSNSSSNNNNNSSSNNNNNSDNNNDSNDNQNNNDDQQNNNLIIKIYEHKIFGEHFNITLEKRVLNRITNLYMYKFFYPLSALFQPGKRDITVNKFAIFRKDLNILQESKLIFSGYSDIKLKYIGYKDILAYSLEAADFGILKELSKIYIEDPSNLIDHSDLFSLPFSFEIFKYCNDLNQQKDYLVQLVKLNKSYLKKFQYSNLFCWLSNLPYKISITLMNFLRDTLLIHPYDINKEHLLNQNNSVGYKAVLNNSYNLVEYVILNRDFFEIKDIVFIKAVVHSQYEIVKLLIDGGVPIPPLAGTSALRLNSSKSSVKMLILLIDGGLEVSKELVKEAATEHMVEQFRLLAPKYPRNENNSFYTDSLLEHLVSCNKIFLKIIREELTSDYEAGIFGNIDYLEDENAKNKIIQNQFKLNTAKLLRQEKFQDIYLYIQDIFDDNKVMEKTFNTVIYESLENFQFDCFYQLIELFYNVGFLLECKDIKLKLITYLIKNNHYNIILCLIKKLKLELNSREFNKAIMSLDLDCDYISKEVLLLVFEWIGDFESNVKIISSTLFHLLVKSIDNNRFSLFKLLNESFFRFTKSNFPTQLSTKISSCLNNQYSIYLNSNEISKSIHYHLIVKELIGYSEEVKQVQNKKNEKANIWYSHHNEIVYNSNIKYNNKKKKKRCIIQ